MNKSALSLAEHQHQLLRIISGAQTSFLQGNPPTEVFGKLLEGLLKLTGSEYGFIGEVFADPTTQQRFIKALALSDISWDETSRRLYQLNADTGMEFRNLNTLFGNVVQTGNVLISNDPLNDPRRGGLPDGHPPLNAFLGIPFISGTETIGMLGLANRPGGYDSTIWRELEVFQTTAATLITAIRVERERQKAVDSLRTSDQQFRELADAIPQIVWIAQGDGTLTHLNARATEYSGKASDSLLGWSWEQVIHPEDLAHTLSEWTDILTTGIPRKIEFRIRRADGIYRWHITRQVPIRSSDGTISRWFGTCTDIEDEKQTQRILTRQNQVLSKIATGEPIRHVLNDIAYLVEDLLPGALCSVLILDHEEGRLRFGAAPSLPDAYNQAIDGVRIGPNVGSCGTAAYLGKTVIVADIETDPLWADFKGLALAYGLHACWSVPILSGNPSHQNRVLGTFAVYHRSPIAPSQDELQVIDRARDLTRVVIERELTKNALLESELRSKSILDHSPTVVYLRDLEGRFRFVNHKATEVFGIPEVDWLGKLPSEVFPGAMGLAMEAHHHVVMKRLENFESEEELQRPNGSTITISTNHFTVMDSHGIPCAVCGIASDITERKQAERDLRLSESRLRSLLEYTPVAIWEEDFTGIAAWFDELRQQGVTQLRDYLPYRSHEAYEALNRVKIREINREAIDQNRASSKAELLAALPHLFSARSLNVWIEELCQLWEGKRLIELETFTQRLDGSEAELVMRIHVPGSPESPEWNQVVVSGTDITTRRKIEQALQQSQQRLQAAQRQAKLGVWEFDIASGNVWWSDELYRIYGQHKDTFTPNFERFLAQIPVDEHAFIHDKINKALTENAPYRFEHRIIRSDGAILVLDTDGTVERTIDGKPIRMWGICQDVTDRKHTDEALRRSEEFLKATGQMAKVGGWELNLKTMEVRWTDQTYHIHELPVGRMPTLDEAIEFYLPEERPRLLNLLERARLYSEPFDAEFRIRTAKGNLIWVHDLCTPIVEEGVVVRLTGTFQDVTSRKLLEHQFRQGQKLEAIGRLAGGVAHDFNNLLTIVNGCSDLLLTDMPEDSPFRELVEDILKAGERGAALTRQLLAFSRQQMLRMEVFDPNDYLREFVKFLSRLVGEDVLLRTRFSQAVGYVKADKSQFEQLIMNLVVNARDAMPTGGELLIQTDRVEVTAAQQTSQEIKTGWFIRVNVADNGHGMPPEVLTRLFEPFFTTKDLGKGTGLGLATVYGIVHQLDGFITVDSEIGKGTTFHVYLPLNEEKSKDGKKLPLPKPTGNETILVVEDDADVQHLTTSILRRQGYRVISAGTGKEAIRRCDELTEPPDLLLTDVVMPGMNGRELAELLVKRFPKMKIVFLSGYTADAILRNGVEENQVVFLQKPFSQEDLTQLIRRVLDGNSG